jgi:hypothetical protein
MARFPELNLAVRKRLAELVKRPYQKRAGCRESAFLEIDKPALRPLPPDEYQWAEYKTRVVPDNYHIEYQGFYYSVPYRYYKQRVTVKGTSTLIEITDEDRKIIAVHERRSTGKRYVTSREHMPANHQAAQDQRGFDGKRYRSWAGAIGVNTYFVIDTLLASVSIEETMYRSCMGILQQAKKYGAPSLEAACKKARDLGSVSYKTIATILKNGQESQPTNGAQPTVPVAAHSNIRGAWRSSAWRSGAMEFK